MHTHIHIERAEYWTYNWLNDDTRAGGWRVGGMLCCSVCKTHRFDKIPSERRSNASSWPMILVRLVPEHVDTAALLKLITLIYVAIVHCCALCSLSEPSQALACLAECCVYVVVLCLYRTHSTRQAACADAHVCTALSRLRWTTTGVSASAAGSMTGTRWYCAHKKTIRYDASPGWNRSVAKTTPTQPDTHTSIHVCM